MHYYHRKTCISGTRDETKNRKAAQHKTQVPAMNHFLWNTSTFHNVRVVCTYSGHRVKTKKSYADALLSARLTIPRSHTAPDRLDHPKSPRSKPPSLHLRLFGSRHAARCQRAAPLRCSLAQQLQRAASAQLQRAPSNSSFTHYCVTLITCIQKHP